MFLFLWPPSHSKSQEYRPPHSSLVAWLFRLDTDPDPNWLWFSLNWSVRIRFRAKNTPMNGFVDIFVNFSIDTSENEKIRSQIDNKYMRAALDKPSHITIRVFWVFVSVVWSSIKQILRRWWHCLGCQCMKMTEDENTKTWGYLRSLSNDKLIEGRPSGGVPLGPARDYTSRPETQSDGIALLRIWEGLRASSQQSTNLHQWWEGSISERMSTFFVQTLCVDDCLLETIG